MRTPPYLKPGDLIYICSPAKAIDNDSIEFAKKIMENNGFRVLVSENAKGKHNYFSGTDEIRAKDFQDGLDNQEVKAILCARGGYGCIRILNYLNWASFIKNPKWILGFSDITVLHQKIFNLGIQSLHSTMPLNFPDNSPQALDSLLKSIVGEQKNLPLPISKFNKVGENSGTLVGGNLSIIYSLLGTKLNYQFDESILFIEDVGEQLYELDRILHSLEYANVFEKINGLIVGGMTNLNDTENPTEFKIEEIILAKLKYRKIPIVFSAPFGHIDDNRSLRIGSKVRLKVQINSSELSYL